MGTKKSTCCNEDMIYLGKSNFQVMKALIGDTYNYCCTKCGKLEWSSFKEKSKYKWYKYDSSALNNLIFRNTNFTKWTFVNSTKK